MSYCCFDRHGHPSSTVCLRSHRSGSVGKIFIVVLGASVCLWYAWQPNWEAPVCSVVVLLLHLCVFVCVFLVWFNFVCPLKRSKWTQAQAFCCLTRAQRGVKCKCVCAHLVLIFLFFFPSGGSRERDSSSLRRSVDLCHVERPSLSQCDMKVCRFMSTNTHRLVTEGCSLQYCFYMFIFKMLHLDTKQIIYKMSLSNSWLFFISFICPILP